MLDRLSGERPAPPLRVLADASEALGLGPRRGSLYTTATPLNRFVDALPAESENVRALEQMAARVARASASAGDTDTLRTQFAVWAANDAAFRPLAEDNALLAELKPLSGNLAAVGATGLRALGFLAAGTAPPKGWVAAETAAMVRMLKPNAEVRLAAARPVQLLLQALGCLTVLGERLASRWHQPVFWTTSSSSSSSSPPCSTSANRSACGFGGT
jgi:hexosaminidase